jgi:hypothetical protein
MLMGSGVVTGLEEPIGFRGTRLLSEGEDRADGVQIGVPLGGDLERGIELEGAEQAAMGSDEVVEGGVVAAEVVEENGALVEAAGTFAQEGDGVLSVA